MNVKALFVTVLAGWAVGCGAAPVDRSDGAETVSTDEAAAKKRPNNCSGTLGCRFAACYDGCLPESNADYCSAYCECRVYKGKTDMQCQMENPYIDIKL